MATHVGTPYASESKDKYRVDKSLTDVVVRAAKADKDGNASWGDRWIDYVLVTGGNWKSRSATPA